jgi:hypothetical protein
MVWLFWAYAGGIALVLALGWMFAGNDAMMRAIWMVLKGIGLLWVAAVVLLIIGIILKTLYVVL